MQKYKYSFTLIESMPARPIVTAPQTSESFPTHPTHSIYSTHPTYPNNQTHPAQCRRDESGTSQTSESFPLFIISQSSQLYNLSKFPIPSFGNLYKIYIRRVKVGNISIVAMGNLTQISNV